MLPISHVGLEQHEGEKITTELSFLGELFCYACLLIWMLLQLKYKRAKQDLQGKGLVIQEHLKQTQENQSRYLLVIDTYSIDRLK